MTGKELKDMRTSLGMTGEDAAMQMAVTVRTWWRWELSEKVNEGRANAFKMANARQLSRLAKGRAID